jgi:predicted phosphodiesterase
LPVNGRIFSRVTITAVGVVRRSWPDAHENVLRLRSAKQVLEAAKANGVTHIIAGHLHSNQVVSYEGVEIICTGSAASDLRAMYGNWIQLLKIDVHIDRLALAKKMLRYEAREGAFVEANI